VGWLARTGTHAGLGNGGLRAVAACFLDSTGDECKLPAMGYGLRTKYGMFKLNHPMAGIRKKPDIGSAS